MLRKTLLVTTALVLATSVAYAGQKGYNPSQAKGLQKNLAIGHPGQVVKGIPSTMITTHRGAAPHNAPPHLEAAKFSNFSKYANAQYVSWYGYRAENISSCYTISSHYFSCYQVAADNALSFTAGVTATTKKAETSLFSFYSSAQYAVNIYSDAGGLPGAVLATSKSFSDSDTSLCCTALRSVALKANLVAGTTYFAGVVGKCCNSDGGWNMENIDFSGAAQDYFHYKEHATYNYGSGTHTTNYSSPWHASSYLPTTGALVLK